MVHIAVPHTKQHPRSRTILKQNLPNFRFISLCCLDAMQPFNFFEAQKSRANCHADCWIQRTVLANTALWVQNDGLDVIFIGLLIGNTTRQWKRVCVIYPKKRGLCWLSKSKNPTNFQLFFYWLWHRYLTNFWHVIEF